MSVVGFRPFKLAQVQLEPAGNDVSKNLFHALDMIRRAASGDGDASRAPELIVLPEYFNSLNTNDGHRTYAEAIPELAGKQTLSRSDLPPDSPTLQALSRAAEETGTYIIAGSMPEKDLNDSSKVYNTMTVWNPKGDMIAKYRKLHLYDVDIPGGITMKESDAISPGTQPVVVEFPFGTVAVAICFDIRFGNLIAAVRQAHPDICAYLLPAAFNLTTGPKAWEVLQRCRAIDNQIYVGMCSPARKYGEEYVAYGHSMLCDCEGKIISTPTSDDQGECIVFSTLDPEHQRAVRAGVPTLTNARTDVYQLPHLVFQ